jgi:3-keto-5-aminohexanoate cleavage enzyme
VGVNDPCIISVAITGSGTTLEQNPNLPCTPEQIARSAIESWNAGAAIAHIHVREPDGRPTHNIDYYREIIQRVTAETDMILNLTTGAFAGLAEEKRLETLKFEPEMGSYDAGSMNFGEGVFLNSPDFLRRMAHAFQEYDVRPELECFDVGMIYNCLRLIEEGLISGPLWWQFVLGVRGGAPATPKVLLHMVELLPEGSQWSAIGLGRGQLPMNTMAIILGGHVRTGMEDNVYYRRGELAQSNAQLVERCARLTRELGRDVASPADARRLLGLKGALGRPDYGA